MGDAMARRRLDLRAAAEVLGTSVDAVRKRIARGTLESEKADGKVYVWLDDGAPRSDTDALTSELRDRLHYVEEQLRAERENVRAEREAHAEARRIIAGLVERIPALEAPESPETAAEEADRAEPRYATGSSQEGVQRSWWRRWFGS